MHWVLLSIGIAIEILATTALKLSDGSIRRINALCPNSFCRVFRGHQTAVNRHFDAVLAAIEKKGDALIFIMGPEWFILITPAPLFPLRRINN